jgi:hypothetical protein
MDTKAFQATNKPSSCSFPTGILTATGTIQSLALLGQVAAGSKPLHLSACTLPTSRPSLDNCFELGFRPNVEGLDGYLVLAVNNLAVTFPCFYVCFFAFAIPRAFFFFLFADKLLLTTLRLDLASLTFLNPTLPRPMNTRNLGVPMGRFYSRLR